jgi:hypothetical protein
LVAIVVSGVIDVERQDNDQHEREEPCHQYDEPNVEGYIPSCVTVDEEHEVGYEHYQLADRQR